MDLIYLQPETFFRNGKIFKKSVKQGCYPWTKNQVKKKLGKARTTGKGTWL